MGPVHCTVGMDHGKLVMWKHMETYGNDLMVGERGVTYSRLGR